MPRGAEKITVSAVRTKSKRGRSMKQIIRFFSAVALMLSVGIFSCVAYGDIQLPDEYSVVAGSGADIGESVFSASASASPQGEYELEVKAFGVFPVKTARVKVSQRRYVTVGGEIFGIRLYTRGVLIVGSERGSVALIFTVKSESTTPCKFVPERVNVTLDSERPVWLCVCAVVDVV